MKHIIKKALLPLLLGCMYQSAGASVVINEAMPCNLNTYMDMGTYEYSPWVESSRQKPTHQLQARRRRRFAIATRRLRQRSFIIDRTRYMHLCFVWGERQKHRLHGAYPRSGQRHRVRSQHPGCLPKQTTVRHTDLQQDWRCV